MSNNTLLLIDSLIKQRDIELKIVDILLHDSMQPNLTQSEIKTMLDIAENRCKLADEYFQQAKYKFLNDLNHG